MRATKFRIVDHNRRTSNGIDYGKVIALRRAKWTVKEIAEDMGISTMDVIKTIDGYKKGEIKIQNEAESYD